MTATQERLAAIFNEWARRYAENPDEFGELLDSDGKPMPDYGECCAFYFDKIEKEMEEGLAVDCPLSKTEFFDERGVAIGVRYVRRDGEVVDHGKVPPSPIMFLFIDPSKKDFEWAIAHGDHIRERGRAFSHDELANIARHHSIADVFIDEGFRTQEVREMAARYRWHCVRSRSNRKRDGIAERLSNVFEA